MTNKDRVPRTPSRAFNVAKLLSHLKRFSVEGLSLASIVAAAFILVVTNFLGARHYTRWDVTESQRYSLSAATLETLSHLKEPVQVWVLLHSSDPMRLSLRQTLIAYEAASSKVEVHLVDPDRDPAAFADAKQRFKMDEGRTAGASVVSDSPAVVAQGDRHWFISHSDLLDLEKADDLRAKPKEERALTGAIRNVTRGTKSRLCFVQGHGERELTDASPDGLSFLQTLLEKDNYELVSMDSQASQAQDLFKPCTVVLIPGPRAPFSKEEEARLRAYLLSGGNALLAVGPLNADTDSGLTRPNLSNVTKPFGIDFDEDLVVETDEKFVLPDSRGIRFLATPKDHVITQALVPLPNRIQLQTVAHFTRSLRAVPSVSDAAPLPVLLLETSKSAYGLVSVAGAANWKDVPEKKTTDIAGPLPLAFASERTLANNGKGPRLVVIGSSSAFLQAHWRVDSTGRGMAMLVENSIAWLASTPQVLDVPERQGVLAGIRITADSKTEIERYVLLYIPLSAVLLGLVVFLFRRSQERAPYKPRTTSR
jgi:ABC-type uncharacterized transport system involved in gliding motility auxiliary subunit